MAAMIFAVFVIPILLSVIWQQYYYYYDDAVVSDASTSSSTTTTMLGSGQMFDKIANRYDMINRVLALRMDIGWRQVMTKRVRDLLVSTQQQQEQQQHPTDDDRRRKDHYWTVLDVATGTADVTIQLSYDLPSETQIVGLDPSNNMLSIGRAKVKALQLDQQITLKQADARDLSSIYKEYCLDKNQPIDAITMAFGIRNVPKDERKKAACELHKLLNHNSGRSGGGILSILEFSEPSINEFGIMGWGASMFIRYVVPFVGGVLSGSPKEYWHLQRSIEDFPTPNEFQRLLQTLECPVMVTNDDDNDDDEDGKNNVRKHVTVSPDMVGYFEMEEIRNLNFGSVQVYVGRAAVRPKRSSSLAAADDPKLPPIGKL